jgi:hypothetical protein
MTPSIVPSNSNVVRELERVAALLAKGGVGGAQRLALLRRQAALGDLRDAVAERLRRSAG